MHGKEKGVREGKSFSINFLFNVSASAPLWEREDASSRHKFAIILLHGDSHPQDPALVVGKAPSLDKFSRELTCKEVHTFQCALVREKDRIFSS